MPRQDPDNDGFNNRYEYALRYNPLGSDLRIRLKPIPGMGKPPACCWTSSCLPAKRQLWNSDPARQKDPGNLWSFTPTIRPAKGKGIASLRGTRRFLPGPGGLVCEMAPNFLGELWTSETAIAKLGGRLSAHEPQHFGRLPPAPAVAGTPPRRTRRGWHRRPLGTATTGALIRTATGRAQPSGARKGLAPQPARSRYRYPGNCGPREVTNVNE